MQSQLRLVGTHEMSMVRLGPNLPPQTPPSKAPIKHPRLSALAKGNKSILPKQEGNISLIKKFLTKPG